MLSTFAVVLCCCVAVMPSFISLYPSLSHLYYILSRPISSRDQPIAIPFPVATPMLMPITHPCTKSDAIPVPILASYPSYRSIAHGECSIIHASIYPSPFCFPLFAFPLCFPSLLSLFTSPLRFPPLCVLFLLLQQYVTPFSAFIFFLWLGRKGGYGGGGGDRGQGVLHWGEKISIRENIKDLRTAYVCPFFMDSVHIFGMFIWMWLV